MDLSTQPSGIEIEPELDAAPGELTVSESVKLLNAPEGTTISPYRSRETILVNGIETSDPVTIDDDDEFAFQTVASNNHNESTYHRATLTYPDGQKTYFRWRCITRDIVASQRTIESLNGNVPYSTTGESISLVATVPTLIQYVDVKTDGQILRSPVSVEAGEEFTLVAQGNGTTSEVDFKVNDAPYKWVLVGDTDTINPVDPVDPVEPVDPDPSPDPEPPEITDLDPELYFSESRVAPCGLHPTTERRNTSKANFRTQLEVEPNQLVVSDCIELAELEQTLIVEGYRGSYVSVNAQPFTAEQQKVNNGDKVVIAGYAAAKGQTYIRAQTTPETPTQKAGTFFMRMTVQTRNDDREPKTYNLPPGTSIDTIAEELCAGDTIILQSGEVYPPCIIEAISGHADKPIKVKASGDTYAIIEGTHSWKPWSVGLLDSHHWHFNKIEIKGAEVIGLLHSSHGLVLDQCHVHDHLGGILGMDVGTGDTTITRCEINETGGHREGIAWKHGVYVASDQIGFPGSTLHISKSFLHHNRGNTIKSRAERLEVYNNWIEINPDDQARYMIEPIGPGVETSHPIQADIAGNVFWSETDYAVARCGNDNTGGSWGITRFADNLFVMAADLNTGLIRTQINMTSVMAYNNHIYKLGVLNLFNDKVTLEDWTHGDDLFYARSNMTNADEMIIASNNAESRITPIDEYLGEAASNNVLNAGSVEIDIDSGSYKITKQVDRFVETDYPMEYSDVELPSERTRPVSGEIIE